MRDFASIDFSNVSFSISDSSGPRWRKPDIKGLAPKSESLLINSKLCTRLNSSSSPDITYSGLIWRFGSDWIIQQTVRVSTLNKNGSSSSMGVTPVC